MVIKKPLILYNCMSVFTYNIKELKHNFIKYKLY